MYGIPHQRLCLLIGSLHEMQLLAGEEEVALVVPLARKEKSFRQVHNYS